jgi:ketosteroid isomerase-like protein
MSEASETVRGAYESFAEQDIPAVLDRLADEVEWDVPKTLPSGGVHCGPDQVAEFFSGLPGAYAELRVEPDEYLDAGDKVVVRGHHRGKGNNGAEFEARFVHTWTLRDGKAAQFVEVADTAAMTPALSG